MTMVENPHQTCKQCGHLNVPIAYKVGIEFRGFWFCTDKCRDNYFPFWDAKKEAEKEEEAKNQRDEKYAKENPALSLTETAQIALEVSNKTSLQEFFSLVEIMESEAQIKQLLEETNQKQSNLYRQKIVAIYEAKNISPDSRSYDSRIKTDLTRCMSLGMNALKKAANLEVSTVSTDGNKIEKNKTWKEIKRDLK